MNKLYLREDYPDWIQRLEAEPLLQNPLLKKDIWHTVEDLDLKLNEHHKVFTFKFRDISQPWLKLFCKLYILRRRSLESTRTTSSLSS